LLESENTEDDLSPNSRLIKKQRKILRHKQSVLFEAEEDEKQLKSKRSIKKQKSNLFNLTPFSDLQKRIDKKFNEQLQKEDSYKSVAKPEKKKPK